MLSYLKPAFKTLLRNRSFRVVARWFLAPVLGLLTLAFLLNFFFPLKVQLNYSPLVTASDGTVLHAFLNHNQKWRMKTELEEITPTLQTAIVYKEDKYFYRHPGVNPAAIFRALFNNTIRGKKTSGASTITMQVARLLEPKERTYGNKLVEIFRAFQLEWYFSKAEILQFYLNLAPYGSNIEGVKSAALLYFQQPPNYLSLAQTVTLAIIPNRPTSLVLGKNNDAILKERNRWLQYFQLEGLFPEKEIEDALQEPLIAKRHAAPKFAPHFSYRLLRQYPQQPIIRTNLDRQKQTKTEVLTNNYVQRLHSLGITNASVLVIDNRTRQVVSYVGSSDFDDAENYGQVDGIRAIRSPGSTLKPFLYALAFDRGLITPKMTLTDVPTDFGGYQPENFDKKFNGNITVEKALAYSLNVPVVKILEQMGVNIFVQQLKQAGFEQVKKDERKLGLSSVLGGCGVKLEELANLFSTFANEGKYAPLQWIKTDSLAKSIPIFSPSAAYLTTEILAQLTRPDLPNTYASSMHLPKIAWKTGTSYGRRDAWSIGYNKQYTIAVWVGNFNGVGAPALSGTDIGTPLLFDLFNALDYNSSNDWYTPPAALAFRSVCTESGLAPEEFCQNEQMDYFLPGITQTPKCSHLRRMFVSADEQFSYCRDCLPQNGYIKEFYPNEPRELVAFYERERIPYQKLPAHNPACSRVFAENAPFIASPADGSEYLVEREEKQQILLSAQADKEVKKVYWYVNDKFYKEAGVHEKVFFQPEPGQLKISCADDKGRSSDCFVQVKYLN